MKTRDPDSLNTSPTTLQDGAPRYVDDGSLVSFVPGVTAQHREDTLNSTLLAQLAANKQYDRWKAPTDWYKVYRGVLEDVGWVVPAYTFEPFTAGAAEFTADEVVIEILKKIGTQEDVAIVMETIEALEVLPETDPVVELFNSESISRSHGNFQTLVASQSDAVLVAKIGAFFFGSEESVDRVFGSVYQSSMTKFFQAALTLNLNEVVYAQVRQEVIDKLAGKDAFKKIASIPTQ